MKLVELQKDEIIVKFKDLNRLFDAVEYFKPLEQEIQFIALA